jgi:hypothetical protein
MASHGFGRRGCASSSSRTYRRLPAAASSGRGEAAIDARLDATGSSTLLRLGVGPACVTSPWGRWSRGRSFSLTKWGYAFRSRVTNGETGEADAALPPENPDRSVRYHAGGEAWRKNARARPSALAARGGNTPLRETPYIHPSPSWRKSLGLEAARSPLKKNACPGLEKEMVDAPLIPCIGPQA